MGQILHIIFQQDLFAKIFLLQNFYENQEDHEVSLFFSLKES